MAAMSGKGYESTIIGLAPAQWLDDTTALYQDAAGTTPATADGAVVARWDDRSGNGKHILQGTDNLRPVLKLAAINSRRAIDSDNDTAAQRMAVALDGTAWTGVTVILVIAPLKTEATRGIWSFADTYNSGTPLVLCQRNTGDVRFYLDGGYRFTVAVANGTPKAFILTGNGTTWRLWVNGVEQTAYNSGLTNLNKAQNVYHHSGFSATSESRVAETVLFNKALDAATVLRIAPLLNAKWGLS
jgi:hypothetical protein